ncbi:MAG TPA: antibiotic biosynthesis monooxygenase [Micropepsaceae bacterium]|jgi:quinol monooxygenase YgiN
MKALFSLLFCALAVLGVTQANAADVVIQGPIHTTTFVEVSPGAVTQTVAMLKEYRDATRKEPGATSANIYQEATTPSRFVSNEVWKDMAAYEAHAKATAATQLAQKLHPIEYGPPDSRTHIGYFMAPGGGAPTANSVVILSHLDVTPNVLPKLMEIMKSLSEGSAKDPGMQTYQILRQTAGAGNHFRLFEIWASDRAFDAHNLAAHTQGFRDELYPLLGTPYDQRKYVPVN